MKVINLHKRTVIQPKSKVSEIVKTLATKEDKVWPRESWPAMRFKNGLKVDAHGGHGIIRYSVEALTEGTSVRFKFSKPEGFLGHHEFEIKEMTKDKTEVIHTIDMKTKGIATLKWIFVIRWLHDALIEDALDKIENQFSETQKRKKWNGWVKFWRFIFKLKL